jgi:isopenicillin-N synthase
MLGLSLALLRGFALALGKPEDLFDHHVKGADTLSAVSLIRYPYLEDYPPVKTAPDGTKLSFEDHHDVSIITVLYQTPVPNLEVETPCGYQEVPTSGDCYLVNCGTYMAEMTNDYFPAPVHRVRYVNAERLSLPFFVHAGHGSRIEHFSPHDSQELNGSMDVSYGQYLELGLRELIVKNGRT